jgi:eukaryotic-like serine/threonine-protein kinase
VKNGDLVGSKYRLVSRLGQGGMGEVWSAQHAQTGREFAIKFLHAFVAQGNDDARHRFLQEARASARVNHPNIIDIFDVGETEDGTLYLVMELLDGLSLGDAFRTDPPLTARELLVLMSGATLALGAAHAAGIVHRDVKPLNIYLHRDRASGLVRPKVLDFGVSKVALGADDGVATQVGSLLGSPRYMAPEQAVSAAAAEGRSDIWSIGVILYEALTGRFPHDGDSSNAIVIAIATRPPTPILDVAPHLPPALAATIDACLRPLESRTQRAEDLAEELQQILATHDLTDLTVVRPAGAKRLIKRPDNFVITTHSAASVGSISGGPLSASLSQRRASIVEQSIAELRPASRPDDAGLEQATQVLPSDSQARQAVALATGAPAGTRGDSTENVSSMTMAQMMASAPVSAPSPPPPVRSRQRLVAAGIAGFALVGAVVAVVAFSKSDEAASPVTSSSPPVPIVAAAAVPTLPESAASTSSASAKPSTSPSAGNNPSTKGPIGSGSKPNSTGAATQRPFDPLRGKSGIRP